MSSTIFFFLFIPLLAFILLAVNLIFAPHNPYMEKNNVFECGFSSFLGQNRTQFSISFFIFALLFLLFDLEILLVYPYLVSAYTNGVYGLAIMLMFLLALTLGFAFELGKKALYIDSRQMSKVATCKSNYLNKVIGNVSLHVSTAHISLHVNTGKNNYSTLRYLAKTINNKQCFILSKSSVLGKKWLYTLGIRPFSTEYDKWEVHSFKENHNSQFRPSEYISGGIDPTPDIYMPGLDAVDHEILWDKVCFTTRPDDGGIHQGFVGILDECNALDQFIDPIHYKYITFSPDEESMPDLAELIANTIKEANTTPEEVWVVLSYWVGDDFGGGGWENKFKCLPPKVPRRINRSSSSRMNPRRKNVIRSSRMYSTSSNTLPHAPQSGKGFNTLFLTMALYDKKFFFSWSW